MWRRLFNLTAVVSLVLFIGYFSVVTFGLRADAPREMGWDLGPELPLRWDAG